MGKVYNLSDYTGFVKCDCGWKIPSNVHSTISLSRIFQIEEPTVDRIKLRFDCPECKTEMSLIIEYDKETDKT